MTVVTSTKFELADGAVHGPYRNVMNPNIHAGEGSIHDQATAEKLGFRGGTVAGSNHMDLFPPLAYDQFGRRWFERGSVSLYFRNATLDREPVRASMRQPRAKDNVQEDVWIHREDGMLVAEGSLAAGDPGDVPALQRIDVGEISRDGVRILADIGTGEALPAQGYIYTAREQAERMEIITEKLTWYEGDSPWGAPIVTPNGMVSALWGPPTTLLRQRIGKAVGLFGAIELRNLAGPMLVDTPYAIEGKILAVGQSPKTEFFWFETTATDAEGRQVSAMRMLLRFMKGSSELWA